jgi:hypothetical protein
LPIIPLLPDVGFIDNQMTDEKAAFADILEWKKEESNLFIE